MSEKTESAVKETMKKAVTNLISAYVITQIQIQKLAKTIKNTEELLNQFKL